MPIKYRGCAYISPPKKRTVIDLRSKGTTGQTVIELNRLNTRPGGDEPMEAAKDNLVLNGWFMNACLTDLRSRACYALCYHHRALRAHRGGFD